MRVVGDLLLLSGVLCLGYFWLFFDTSVDVPTYSVLGHSVGGGRVNNEGLMADRQIGVIVGVAAALAGLVMIVAGRPGQPQSDSEAGAGDRKKCPYCKELILADAIKCRFCGSALDASDTPTGEPRT